MVNKLKLFTLHSENDRPVRSNRASANFLAYTPQEVAERLGAQFIPRDGGKCSASTDGDELGVHGYIVVDKSQFRELDEIDEALAGEYPADYCFTKHGLNFLVMRSTESVSYAIREEHVDFPAQETTDYC